MDKEKIMLAVSMLLEAIGEDVSREGLKKTPQRVAEMYEEVLGGMTENPQEHLRVQFHENGHGEMVLIKDIPVYSTCEHHLMPFFGKAHVAYIPSNGVITGLSKIARVVDGYARRLQLQERLTAQIADAMMAELDPQGVLVVIEAEHMCMTMRGIKKAGSTTITSAVRGAFKNSEKTRAEALSLINA